MIRPVLFLFHTNFWCTLNLYAILIEEYNLDENFHQSLIIRREILERKYIQA